MVSCNAHVFVLLSTVLVTLSLAVSVSPKNDHLRRRCRGRIHKKIGRSG